MRGEEGDVLPEPLRAIGGTVRQAHLAAEEALRLVGLRPRAGAVEVERVAGLAADHGVDRLVAELAEQVPQREVDHRDGGDGDALPAIGQAGAIDTSDPRAG